MTMLSLLSLLALIAASSPAPSTAELPSREAKAAVRDMLHLTDYDVAVVDLNGDGQAEIIVYANDPGSCGSGGCDLFVLTPRGRTFAVVMRASVVRLPVRMLATSTHGWRDLGVMVAGGGIRRAYAVRLRFDGRNYPGNPTVRPAMPTNTGSGTILIDAAR